jgi:hypothetical protein
MSAQVLISNILENSHKLPSKKKKNKKKKQKQKQKTSPIMSKAQFYVNILKTILIFV